MSAVFVSKLRFGSPRSRGLLRLALLVVCLSMVKLMLDGNAVSNGLKDTKSERFNSRKEMHGSATRWRVLIGNPVRENRVRMFLELNLASTLKGLGILSDSETCYAKFYWNGSNIITEEDAFQDICRGISEPMYQRLDLYTRFLELVLKQKRMHHRFGFLLDLADATRNYKKLYKALPFIKFASFAKGHLDTASVLLPDPHMVLALGYLWNLKLKESFIPEVMFGFAEKISRFYSPNNTAQSTPWDSKRDEAVYRGACNPTIDPESDRKHSARQHSRGRFCSAALKLDSGIDFGIHDASQCSEKANEWGKYCWPCCTDTSYTAEHMAASYRYQLAIDGHGPSYDATVWKFLSRSTVFLAELSFDTRLELLYYQYLEEGQDYLRVTPDTLGLALRSCQSQPSRCRRIASNGYNRLKSILTWDFLIDATWDALQHLFAI